MNRAYSVIDFRSVDDEKRIIEGIASTPEVDSYRSVLEPMGAQFQLPMPLLIQHDSKKPIGHVIDVKATKDGIRIRAQIECSPKPGVLDYLEDAWYQIKLRLVRGLSVGFDSIEETFDKSFGGIRYTEWKWLELSAVTIPANTDANIYSVRSAYEASLALSGTKTRDVVRLTNRNSPAVVGQTKGNPMKKTIREQITDFENKRAANQSAMDEIMDKAAEETRSLAAEESEKYDGLKTENTEIGAHLDRLKDHEKSVVARAVPVAVASAVGISADPQKQGEQVRRHEPITVKRNDPKGIVVARMAIALHNAKGIKPLAAQMAREHWPDNPEVEMLLKMQMRTGVDAGDTTTSGWASQLAPAATQAAGEFLEMLRAATILGRIPGIRTVPFNIAIPIQSGTGTYGWVAEAAAKPVSSLTFTSVTLRWAKVAGIIVITQELARFSNPSAEMIIRDEMVQGATRFIDAQFVGSAAEVSNVSPAGILNGISATTVTAATAAAFRTDMNNMLNNFAANNVPLAGIVLIMSSTQALALSLIVTDLGVPLFPNINQSGGSVLGFPVIVSEAVGTKIIALYTPNIFVANGEGINIDVSTEASVEMETTPAVGEQSPLTTVSNLKSFWQNNLVGFRVEQFITWKAGRTAAVEYLSPVAYVP